MSPVFIEEPDPPMGGAPKWMLTYGDVITLLVTFFVLLLTFSTPDDEDFQQLAKGMLKGHQRSGVSGAKADHANLVAVERTLDSGRLDVRGSESPALDEGSPLSALKYYCPEVDISTLPDLSDAIVVRIPLVELFGTDAELDRNGREALDHVVRMMRARPSSVVVRAKAGAAVLPAERGVRSVLLAAKVVEYLQHEAGSASDDVGLSDNVALAGSPLGEGQCEIIVLEV